MSATPTPKSRSGFNRAMETIERLGLDEQEALVDVVQRRIAEARRAAMVREVAASRRDYRRGKVRRGSAKDLMAELRPA
jgi:hypothetical protein